MSLPKFEGHPANIAATQYPPGRKRGVVDWLVGKLQLAIKLLGKLFGHRDEPGGSAMPGSKVSSAPDVLGLINKAAAGVMEREMAMGWYARNPLPN